MENKGTPKKPNIKKGSYFWGSNMKHRSEKENSAFYLPRFSSLTMIKVTPGCGGLKGNNRFHFLTLISPRNRPKNDPSKQIAEHRNPPETRGFLRAKIQLPSNWCSKRARWFKVQSDRLRVTEGSTIVDPHPSGKQV